MRIRGATGGFTDREAVVGTLVLQAGGGALAIGWNANGPMSLLLNQHVGMLFYNKELARIFIRTGWPKQALCCPNRLIYFNYNNAEMVCFNRYRSEEWPAEAM